MGKTATSSEHALLGSVVTLLGIVCGSCIMDLDRKPLRTQDAGGEDAFDAPVEQDAEQEAGQDAEAATCGDGTCDESAGESCSSCPSDCGVCECETDVDCPSGEACVDRECVDALAVLCGNDVDDDGDGLIDCRDPDCYSNGCYADCLQEDDDASCSDGMDNDYNGKADCDDDNCAYSPHVTVCPCGFGAERECSNDHCTDGVDDDDDGKPDCEDEDCRRSAHVTACNSENTDALCSDDMDNDDNGFADCNDSLCLLSVWVSVCCEPGGG
jgi:hypothetical protein